MEPAAEYPARFCPCCSSFVPGEFRPGPGGRPDASCPKCGSLERQRFLALLLAALQPALKPIGTLLDIAPTELVGPMLDGLGAERRLRVDLGADPRAVDCFASLTQLPLPDESVDFLICYHVLEHVPDDRTAMRELARVLSPGAIGLMQVPWKPDVDTDEDPSAPESERLRRFGQADHVRWYGRDLEARLMECGLGVRRVDPRTMLGDAACTLMRLNPVEAVWILTASDDPTLRVSLDSDIPNLVRAFDALVDRLAAERAQRDRARARVQRLKSRVERQAAELERLRGRQGAGILRAGVRRVGAAVRRTR
ncbi:SAM-dependent methyltransferase [Nocardioides marmoriginsengisoli]|uniref:SAM-dependent methyltransferase n=1 Tax=Nocardioides marmoriginsengisoli TaxID=661483 RepID=A0A3N0CCQ3_9ACTN|nr:class I SAM-dependent methyltransferase [Nocardioides marmoriginsengisoli]RNL61198.1 SAM-dependent methyltransferase [Nocardioides marmoriginsengisoli]